MSGKLQEEVAVQCSCGLLSMLRNPDGQTEKKVGPTKLPPHEAGFVIKQHIIQTRNKN
jgi:hypothetical protein